MDLMKSDLFLVLSLVFQATFKITLEVPSELIALSNMPVVEEKVNGNLKTVYYQESPIMSTYLVAVVVGLFDYVEDHTSDGILITYNHLFLYLCYATLLESNFTIMQALMFGYIAKLEKQIRENLL